MASSSAKGNESKASLDVIRIDGNTSCPSCNGFPTVNPFQKFQDSGCIMCQNTGKVHLTRVCACGRPAGWVVNGQDTCWMPKCWKDAEDGYNLLPQQYAMRPTMGQSVYSNDGDLNQKIANAMNEQEDEMSWRWGWGGL